jgi:putative hemolysin
MKSDAASMTENPYDDNFSYASPADSRAKQWLIKVVERITGAHQLVRIYQQLKLEKSDPFNLWGRALEKLNIKIDYDEEQLGKIPQEGPVIIIANHPFGLVDGAILLHLTTRIRRDYFLLINEVLAHEPSLKEHLLPVDFNETKEALATNLETRRLTSERLHQGQALVIFPGGGVATIKRPGGPAEEFPWRPFIAGKVHENQCPVVPIYFHGLNSPLFHLVSKASMNLRLGLFIREALNKRGQTIKVNIGDPIPYAEMKPYRKRAALIQFLQEKTFALKDNF